jgi:flagellar motility protein MotE (MotC chaperone)
MKISGQGCILIAGIAAILAFPSAGVADTMGDKLDADIQQAASARQPASSAMHPPQLVWKQSDELPLCTSSEEVFSAIELERRLLAVQRADIDERRATLELAREQLDLEADRLEAVRDEIDALLARVEAAQTADLERLVRIYRNMDAEEAAAILDDLDMETTVMVLGTMPERAAAPILANLDPFRARALSRILLERSKLPADQDFSDIVLR